MAKYNIRKIRNALNAAGFPALDVAQRMSNVGTGYLTVFIASKYHQKESEIKAITAEAGNLVPDKIIVHYAMNLRGVA